MLQYARIVMVAASLLHMVCFSIQGSAEQVLVQEEQAVIKVHPTFNALKKTFLRMITFSYSAANHFHFPWGYHKTPKEIFDKDFGSQLHDLNKDWEVVFFEGKVGIDSKMPWHQKVFADIRERVDKTGFIAYHRYFNIAAVVLHGSHSQECWKTNFDFDAEDGSLTGHRGLLHRGFALKYASMRASYHTALDQVLDTMAARGERQTLQLYFLGHSQGAALGQLAIADLSSRAAAMRQEKTLFAAGWFLSSPVVCLDETSWSFIQEVVGRTNIILQDCDWDLTQKNFSLWFQKASEVLQGGIWNTAREKLRELLGAKSYEIGVHVKQRDLKKARGVAAMVIGVLSLPFTLLHVVAHAHFGEKNAYGDYFFREEMVDAEAFSN